MPSLEQHIMECNRAQASIFGYLRQVILSLSPDITEEVRGNTAYYNHRGIEYSVRNVTTGTVLYVKSKNSSFGRASEKTFHFASFREIDADKLISSLTSAVTSQRVHANYR